MFSSQTVKTLERFDPATASRKRCWLIIGGRNTGKSVLLKDLLIKTNRGDEMIVAMTATVSTANMLRQMLPEGFVLDEGYDHVKADQFLAMGRKLVRMGKQKNLTLVTTSPTVLFRHGGIQIKTNSGMRVMRLLKSNVVSSIRHSKGVLRKQVCQFRTLGPHKKILLNTVF